MRHIENIVIKGFSATPITMQIGSNRQFKKQRQENPEYDDFLNELELLLEGCENKDAKNVYKTLRYGGNVWAIIRDVMPHINDMYNDGYTPKGCMKAILDGTWFNFDYCYVYENIEFVNFRFFKKFLQDYLKLIQNSDESVLIERKLLSCTIDGKTTKMDDEITESFILGADKILLKTMIKIPYSRQELGVSYWKKLHLNIPDFRYRAIIEHKGEITPYVYAWEIKEAHNDAYLSFKEWTSPFFFLSLDGEVSSQDMEMLDSFATRYGLAFPCTFDKNLNLGGKITLSDSSFLEFFRNLEKLVDRLNSMHVSVNVEGLFTSFDSSLDYLKENIQIKNMNGKVISRVISIPCYKWDD